MRISKRPCWAVVALTLCYLPVLAQAPQSAVPAPPPSSPAPSSPPAQSPAAAPSNPAPAANAIAATVNDQNVLESTVQRALQHVPPDKQSEARPKIVHFLVDQMLLDQFLVQQKIAVDTKEIEAKMGEIKADLKKQNKDFAKELEQAKMTEAELREHLTADMRWGKYAEERANDKVLKELFDSQKYLFDGTMIHARHLLLMPTADDAKTAEQTVAQLQAIKQAIDKQVADELAKLPAGTDNLAREKKRQSILEEAFAAQAKAKSACPSKDKGGDVGWFQGSGMGSMVEPFSKVAFTIKPYEISEPVKTPFGYHLILVTDRKPGREVKFEEVKEAVKDHYCTLLHDSIVAQERQHAKIVVPSR
jgi:peptidyl-prolyl cis-trans isomerase C